MPQRVRADVKIFEAKGFYASTKVTLNGIQGDRENEAGWVAGRVAWASQWYCTLPPQAAMVDGW